MNQFSQDPQAQKTPVYELLSLQRELQAVKREKQELYEELRSQYMLTNEQRKEIEQIRSKLDGICQSKSWRWTSLLRRLGKEHRKRRRGRFFSHLKKLWEEMGSPCPRLVRFIRHRILGKMWPARTEMSV